MSMNSLLLQHPAFGLLATVGAYSLASLLQRKWRWMHPLFACSGLIIALLSAARIPYAYYSAGADLLTLLLGPATVALGVPLYKHAGLIRRHIGRIGLALLAGSATGIAGAATITGLLGGSKDIVLSMLPKSASSPIAIEISRQLGGIPELTTVLTVLTGLFGSMTGTRLLRWLGIKDDLSIGLAIGAAAHGIGTARLIRDSETQGSFSGLAMAVTGIMTSLLFIPVYFWMLR